MKYLGVLLLVLSGNVMAEEVYYCSDIDANGFSKKDGQYKAVNFTDEKFKMKVQDDGNIVIENPEVPYSARFTRSNVAGKELYLCSTPFGMEQSGIWLEHYKSYASENNNGYFFNFNPEEGRYIWIHGYGYVFNRVMDVTTRIGTCTKF